VAAPGVVEFEQPTVATRPAKQYASEILISDVLMRR
jgi:hypothetical protein